jgi:hypothetical protein
MILFHDVIQTLDLPNDNRRAVLSVVPSDRVSIRLTPGNMIVSGIKATDGLGQKTPRGLLIPVLGEPEIERLPRLIHGAIEVASFALHLNV